MMKWWPFALCSLALTRVSADDLSDFSNDLATDVGPLLVLFGEAMTRQYLSESTSFLDYFIFAMAPIGILTAVVSAIRVCGHSTLRAFIGRSQEGDGIVEAELCTSTSRDVCELFNKGGITRVLGRPSILELIYVPGKGEELHLFRHYLDSNHDQGTTEWTKVQRYIPGFGRFMDNSSLDHPRFAPKPNLSLNVGIKKRPRWVFLSIAALGLLLQAGVLVLAGVGVWVLEWNLSQSGSPASKNYALVMFIIGTVVMCGGMWSCAALIGQTTQEVRYSRKKRKPQTRLLWLQPGPQVIGDQSFDAFAYLENTETEPLPVWTSSRKDFDERFELYTFFAVAAVVLGYTAQFIGLRGMKAWVSLAQLGITVIMSILRALLRVQRLGRDANTIRKMPDLIAGHELDWLAFELTTENSLERPFWCITGQYNKADVQESDVSPTREEYNGESKAIDICKRHSNFGKILSIRQRLSHLTGHNPAPYMIDKGFQQWETDRVKVRDSARMLGIAICQVVENLFRNKPSKDPITVRVQIISSTGDDEEPIKEMVEITMKPPSSFQTQWTIESSKLEAVLGLSMWSLVSDESLQYEDEAGNLASRLDYAIWMRITSCLSKCEGQQPQHGRRSNEMGLWFGPDARTLVQEQVNMDKNDVRGLIDVRSVPDAPIYQHRYYGWNMIHDSSRSREIQQSSPFTTLQLGVVTTEDSLPKICAQDLFLAILSPLVHMFAPGQTDILESGGHVLLQNSTVNALSNILHDSGLASRFDSLSCAVSLLSTKLHPDPESLLSDLLDAANNYRRNEEWERAETLMQWVCLHHLPLDGSDIEPSIEPSDHLVKSLRMTGELYRWSITQRSDKERLEFGIEGIGWMLANFNPFSSQNSQVKQVLEDYENIAKSLSNENSKGLLAPNLSRSNSSREEHPLVQAIADGDRRMALLLLCLTANEDFNRVELTPALPLSARNNWTEVVNAILEMGGSIDSQDGWGRTSVSHLAEHGNISLLRHFISLSASLRIPGHSSGIPLLYALECNQGIAAEVILQAGPVELGPGCEDFTSPLYLAIENGLLGAMQLLLDQQARHDPSMQVGDCELIVAAARTGNNAVLEALLERNISIDSIDDLGRTPLLVAMENGNEATARLLLAYAAAPTTQPRVWTSLLFAVVQGHWTCVQLFLQTYIANKSLSTSDLASPPVPTAAPQRDVLNILSEIQDSPSAGGHSTSSNEILSDVERVVEILIGKGARLEQHNDQRQSLLVMAVVNEQVDAVEVLLRHGVSTYSMHRTALSHACETGNERIIRLLLMTDAVRELRHDRGLMPWPRVGENAELIRRLVLEVVSDDETKESIFQALDEHAARMVN